MKAPIATTMALVIAAIGFVASGASGSCASEFITVGTGGVTGVYYPTGGAICRLVNKDRKVHGIRCSVESTGGSTYNIDTIRAGELDLGIAQSDLQAAAYEGSQSFKDAGPFKELRAVFSAHAEPLHLLARADAGIAMFMDVNGKRVNIGNAGSGQRETVELILDHLGWDKGVFSLAAELKSAEQSRALCDNKIDAVFFTAGIPNASIREATSSCATRIVPMAGDWVDGFVSKYPAYARATIPGGIYKGTEEDIPTFGPKATVVSSTRLRPDVVYQVVKAVFENLDEFKKLHPAFGRLRREEMAKDSLAAPLHEGAIRYFKEAGLL